MITFWKEFLSISSQGFYFFQNPKALTISHFWMTISWLFSFVLFFKSIHFFFFPVFCGENTSVLRMHLLHPRFTIPQNLFISNLQPSSAFNGTEDNVVQRFLHWKDFEMVNFVVLQAPLHCCLFIYFCLFVDCFICYF